MKKIHNRPSHSYKKAVSACWHNFNALFSIYIENKEDMVKNSVEESIIDFLKTTKESSFGDMVKQLPYSYDDILENVISLKDKGRITKQTSPPGYYRLI